MVMSERTVKRSLILIALTGLAGGLAAWALGYPQAARWIWGAGTVPVILGLAVAMIRDFMEGRLGVDAVAFVSMSAAVALGETLAGVVVAVMYAGGNVLEDFAVARAERELRALIDRAPRIAHRFLNGGIEDVDIGLVAIGDRILVRGGEVVPVDGVIVSPAATIDESALTGEPIPVERHRGEGARSGTINAGEAFEIQATATAGESTYAGIVRLVTAAQPRVLARLAGEGRNDRRHQKALGDDDGRGGEEQAPRAQRACPREHKVDEEAHHDARQAQQRVERDDHRPPPGEAPDRYQCAEGQADRGAEQRGGKRELE